MQLNKDKWLNELRCGDNIEVLKNIPDESVDLIYIDPPFFSNKDYEVIWGNGAELRSFGDRWKGGIEHYVGWMIERLRELHRVLKPTGSIYVHLDGHAVHYIKVEMDKIFGYENFQNEIIWHYRRWTGSSSSFLKMHDNILFYSKSKDYYFDPQYVAYTGESQFRKQNYHTRIKEGEVYVTSVNEKGVKANDVFEIHDIEDLATLNNIFASERVNSIVCKYLDSIQENADHFQLKKKTIKELENIQKAVKSEFSDTFFLSLINSQANERIGYPTQKPEALLERIIKA